MNYYTSIWCAKEAVG